MRNRSMISQRLQTQATQSFRWSAGASSGTRFQRMAWDDSKNLGESTWPVLFGASKVDKSESPTALFLEPPGVRKSSNVWENQGSKSKLGLSGGHSSYSFLFPSVRYLSQRVHRPVMLLRAQLGQRDQVV